MLSALIFILQFILIPFFLGVVLVPKKDAIERYLVGFCTLLALYFLFYFVSIGNSFKLSTSIILVDTFSAIIIVLFFIINIIYNKRNNKKYSVLNELKSESFGSLKNAFASSTKFVKVIFIISILFILFQALRMIFVSPYIDGDDTTYGTLVQSMSSLNSIYNIGHSKVGISEIYSLDKKYQVSSYYPFLAAISKVTGIHSMILMKTIIPVFFILMSYAVAWLFSGFLFKEAELEKRAYFMLILAVFYEFSFNSYYSFGRRLLMWTWNSKSLCFTIVLPFLMLETLKYFSSYKNEEGKISFSNYYIIIYFINMACASITLMGTIVGAIMLIVMALSDMLQKRRIIPEILLGTTCLPYFINVLFILTWR